MTPEQEKLFNDHIGYAHSFARLYAMRKGLTAEHSRIKNSALIGLWKACLSYDPNKTKFTTYSVYRMLGEVLDDLRKQERNAQRASKLEGLQIPKEYQYEFLTKIYGKKDRTLENPEDTQVIINKLPPQYRQVFTLIYIKGLSKVETGKRLGVSESRIGQIHKRGIWELRRRYNVAQ